MTERYQFLREGLRILENAGLHLFRYRINQKLTQDELDTRDILRTAHHAIREELKHPERFNVDGTKRAERWVRIPAPKKVKQ